MVIVIETHTEPVNPPSASPIITHAQMWDGVIHGLRNNHLLVTTINSCKVLSHTEEELVLSQTLDEHTTIGHKAGEHKNTFKLFPPSKFDGTETETADFHCIGIISQGPGAEDKDLYFTLVHEWTVKGVEKGSAEHEELKKGNYHPGEYAKAFVDNARKLVKEGGKS